MQDVQPRCRIKALMITDAREPWHLRSLSFKRKHTLVIDSFRKCMASNPGICSPLASLPSRSKSTSQASCMASQSEVLGNKAH